MKRWQGFYFSFLFTLFCTSAMSQDYAATNMGYYQEKLNKYLDKSNALSPYYRINELGIRIYSSKKNKLADHAEFSLPWCQISNYSEILKRCPSDKIFDVYKNRILTDSIISTVYSDNDMAFIGPIRRLEGIRIAIDPGHIAHNFEIGIIEQKSLQLGDSIAIAEGVLTFATATLLKEKLEREGAIVFVTRPADSICSFGMTLEECFKQSSIDSLFALNEISEKQKGILMNTSQSMKDRFKYGFKSAELAKRASVINEFKPDLSIIIHFNVDETNRNWTKTSKRNFNMCFVGGAFMRNELKTPEKRFEFLRLLVSRDLESSIVLSTATMHHFENVLCVKPASMDDATYFKKGCLPVNNEGVFCRNLQLTRMVHGPLVYGETLYQDNETECVLLNEETDKCKNQRIQEVAEAYFQGVMHYETGYCK